MVPVIPQFYAHSQQSIRRAVMHRAEAMISKIKLIYYVPTMLPVDVFITS